MSKTNKKSYEELLGELGNALMDRGEYDADLAELEHEKVRLRKLARRAKWFTEDRYKKWAAYFTCRADIVHLKQVIASNNRKIAALEDRIACFGIPTPPGEHEMPADANAGQKPNITMFEEADFEDSSK